MQKTNLITWKISYPDYLDLSYDSLCSMLGLSTNKNINSKVKC